MPVGVIHRAPQSTPVTLVELDEGPWLEMQVVGGAPDSIIADLRVRIEFERPGGEALPVVSGVEQ